MSFWFKIQALSLITCVSHFSWNSCFLFHKTGYIPKAPLFPFRGLLTFFFFFWKPGQPPLLSPPGSLPVLPPSHVPQIPNPPAAAGHLGNAAASRMVQVTRSQREEFQSFTFVPSISKMSLALPLLLQPCCSSLHSCQPFLLLPVPRLSLFMAFSIHNWTHSTWYCPQHFPLLFPPPKKSVETLKQPKRQLLIPDNSISAICLMPSLTWRASPHLKASHLKASPHPPQYRSLVPFTVTALESIQKVSGFQWILTSLQLPNACCTQLRPRSYRAVCWNPTTRLDYLMREVCIPYLCTLGSNIWPVSHDTSCTNQLPFPASSLWNSPPSWAFVMSTSNSYFEI